MILCENSFKNVPYIMILLMYSNDRNQVKYFNKSVFIPFLLYWFLHLFFCRDILAMKIVTAKVLFSDYTDYIFR